MHALQASRGRPPSMSRESHLPRPGLLLGTATPCPESHACLGSGSCWGQPRHIQRVTLASARAPVGDSHAMSRESGLPRLDSHVQLKAVALQQYSCLLPLNQVTQFLLCIWQRVTDVTSSAPALEGHILKIIIKKTFKHSTEPRE